MSRKMQVEVLFLCPRDSLHRNRYRYNVRIRIFCPVIKPTFLLNIILIKTNRYNVLHYKWPNKNTNITGDIFHSSKYFPSNKSFILNRHVIPINDQIHRRANVSHFQRASQIARATNIINSLPPKAGSYIAPGTSGIYLKSLIHLGCMDPLV